MNLNAARKSPTVVLAVLLSALAVSNVLLLRQNLQLRAALRGGDSESVRAGETVPAFAAEGLRGEKIDVRYTRAGAKRVLFYFTPTCPFCRQQFVYWRELLARADRERFEVLGITSDREDRERLEKYLRLFNCGGDSPTPLRVALVPDEVRRSYKLSSTPITLVIDNDGVVEKSWTGRWGAGEAAEAGRLFGLSFSLAAK